MKKSYADQVAAFEYIFDTNSSEGNATEWNLVEAFNEVINAVQQRLAIISDKGKSAYEYLTERLHMTKLQVSVISIIIDNGLPISWKELAEELGKTRLTMMSYAQEVEELVNTRRWLVSMTINEGNHRSKGFDLAPGVIQAIRHNEVFEPENLTGLEEQNFVDRLNSYLNSGYTDRGTIFCDSEQWLMYIVKQNLHLPLCSFIDKMESDVHNKCLLLLIVSDYADYAGREREGLSMHVIDNCFPEDWECDFMRRRLSDGSHDLIANGYVEYKCCKDGMADHGWYKLTQKAKDELLPAFQPRKRTVQMASQYQDRDLIHYEDIKEKILYYNTNEGRQMARLAEILSPEQLPEIQKRLSDKGMRTGVAVLLCGGPGTGKTESVRQLARQTGRDLLMIDVSQIKDKFVGESEKNTKAIFNRYKRLCTPTPTTQHPTPILFINECDAILGKRMENAENSADKMQNSMQNILLQALEDLEGVIICTTNLAQSLDPAFERRFLMKVEFEKPDITVRAHIWQSMIPSLTESEAMTLAERYSFSGGQCENVMRKATIEEIINGTKPTFEQLDAFCKEETLLQKDHVRPIVGFAA